MSLACAALLAACASEEPDVVERGAVEIPGTLGADYLGSRPFSLAPGGARLVYAVTPVSGTDDPDPERLDLELLRSFRILDLETGTRDALPPAGKTAREALVKYGLLHEAPCWLADGESLLFRTAFPAFLRVDTGREEDAWQLLRERPPGYDPECHAPREPLVASRVIGPFRVERPNGTGLRVTLSGASRTLLDLPPGGLGDQITVAEARLAPDGTRLALVYAEGTGSFTGPSSGVVLSAGPGPMEPVRLGRGVLTLRWRDERQLIGYARPSGRREYALFAWDLGR
ncbi:MAG: hypothetical protein R3298_01355 [Gammaproteobacteria bacterium]|nr:hypothetical protein [Gammaproteobacteria bacterium]